ncbi:hypothetical protein M378DRAFT_14702 [Amanita muscaria Koide BX008]|uniref:Uncharacterized protein n=1 Tax=Amanita muscaria (strain Koide BX008) TaxID=946122 RepID=A0A0C2SZK8_AMAMK|nr:hypothetical protein M378DRAFT_14702 [Amanita muscaria Koide BX008]
MFHAGGNQHLFSDASKANTIATADGQLVHILGKVWNPTSIVTLLISGICFAIYLWFYLSPLLRGQGPTSRHRTFIDTEMNAPQDAEKASLITWIHRSSLGRFSDLTGRFDKADEKSTDYYHLRPPLSRGSSFTSNLGSGSCVPNAVPLSPPPLAYPAGSNGSVEFELNRHQSSPPSPLTNYAPSVRSNFDTNPRSLRSQPPSPLQTERF